MLSRRILSARRKSALPAKRSSPLPRRAACPCRLAYAWWMQATALSCQVALTRIRIAFGRFLGRMESSIKPRALPWWAALRCMAVPPAFWILCAGPMAKPSKAPLRNVKPHGRRMAALAITPIISWWKAICRPISLRNWGRRLKLATPPRKSSRRISRHRVRAAWWILAISGKCFRYYRARAGLA